MVVNPSYVFRHDPELLEYFGGKYMVFEGCDGSGKSALIDKFLNCPEVRVIREPGTDAVGKSIDKILKENDLTLETQALLYQAARCHLYANDLAPALHEKYLVMSDRSWVSSKVYQLDPMLNSDGTPEDYDDAQGFVSNYMELTHSTLKQYIKQEAPHIIVYCDSGRQEAINRLKTRGVMDKTELQDMKTDDDKSAYARYQRLFTGYLYLMNIVSFSLPQQTTSYTVDINEKSPHGEFHKGGAFLEKFPDVFTSRYYDYIVSSIPDEEFSYIIYLNTDEYHSVEDCFENLYKALKTIPPYHESLEVAKRTW